MTTAATPDRVAIRKVLAAKFNDEELATLAFDVGLNREDLPATTRAARARELIACCENTGKLNALTAEIERLRPGSLQTKKQQGGQPNNTNALKHGLYSAHLQELQLDDLETMMTHGVNDEIAMLRAIMARVLRLAGSADNLDTAQNLLGSLGVASTRLAGLIKTQRLLEPQDGNDISRQLGAALGAVVKEFCLNE